MRSCFIGWMLVLLYFVGECVDRSTARRARFSRRRKAASTQKQHFHMNGWGTQAPEPEFVGHIQSTTVIAGKDAILRCVVENLGAHKVAWQAVAQKLQISIATNVFVDKDRIQVTTTNYTSWFLHIKNVTQSDSGYYACQISTNPIKSQAGFLSVVEPPEFMTNMTSRNVSVMENRDVILSCNATGNPPPIIKWKREDGQQFTVDNQMYSEYVGPELRLAAVTRAHMAAYICLANNDVPPAISRRMYLDVKFHPLIWIQNHLVGAREGIDVYLECHTEAHPKSENFWLRNEVTVASISSRYQTQLTRNSYTTYMKLTIRNLQPEDYGDYQCVAKNEISTTQGSIKLYRPHIVQTSRPSTQQPSTLPPRKPITVTTDYKSYVTEVIRKKNTYTPGKQQKYGHERDNFEDSLGIKTVCVCALSVLLPTSHSLWVMHFLR